MFHPEKEAGEDPCDLKHNVPDKCKGRQNLQRPKPGELSAQKYTSYSYFIRGGRNDIYVSYRLQRLD